MFFDEILSKIFMSVKLPSKFSLDCKLDETKKIKLSKIFLN